MQKKFSKTPNKRGTQTEVFKVINMIFKSNNTGTAGPRLDQKL
jgi:hypothetical protein